MVVALLVEVQDLEWPSTSHHQRLPNQPWTIDHWPQCFVVVVVGVQQVVEVGVALQVHESAVELLDALLWRLQREQHAPLPMAPAAMMWMMLTWIVLVVVRRLWTLVTLEVEAHWMGFLPL